MRSKASLFLMEQLIMVLVFALAAALCLQVFVRAEEISLESARRDDAVIVARNAAELLKAGRDATEAEADPYELRIQELPSEIPGLGQTEIAVLFEGEALYVLTVGYQEVGG